jgi:Ca-activated chloride channel family protein
MFYFKDIEFLWLLILLLPLLFLIKNRSSGLENIFSQTVLEKIEIKKRTIPKKIRDIILVMAMALVIVAIARPVINNGEIKVKSSFINIVTAIDMSKSMFADDIYPNRFEFAKNKFYNSLKYLKNAKVALIGFSSQTFLISPLTEDFHSLKFLAKNLNLDYLSLKGTDILTALKAANNLFGKEKKKILLLFTDGGDESSFDKEIEYAKKHDIAIYVYNIGTTKGGVIKTKDGVLKDKNGDIVVVKRNDAIKELALKSGGAFLKYSLQKDDIKALTDDITRKFKAKEQESSTIKDTKELFYYPLALAIILFFISLFSLPKRRAR